MLAPPLGLVPIDVSTNLTGPGAERPDVRGELLDLPGHGFQGEAVCGKGCPELRIGGDRGVPDPVDRLDHVSHTHRVQAPPRAGRPHAGVDLEVQMPVRVPGPGGVVPDPRGLDPLDRPLHLPTPRPYTGGRVPRDPTDNLDCGLVRGFVQCGRDLRMKRRCQRPGLRAVDGDLDEPQRVRILADPTLLASGVEVDPGDPLLVDAAGHRAGVLDAVRGRGEPGRHSAALGEVVVICPRAIPLDVGACGLRRAVVELHPAMHPDHRLHDVRRQPTDP